MKTYKEAFSEGKAAVHHKPLYAPKNPYFEEEDKEAYRGWEDGAIEAGICEIYTNGVLNKEHRN